MKNRLALMLSLSLIFIAPVFGGAQDNAQCSALVEDAFTLLGESCNNLDRNSICYGNDRVDATFHEAVADDFFTKPGDTTELTSMESVRTYGLDEILEQWGIALMRVQANVPNTLPGQSVIFILLGEAAVENAVEPEDALTPSDLAVDVTTTVRANLRSGPGLNSNVIDVTDAGSVLTADALSEGFNWLRVLYNDAPAWVNHDVVNAADSLDSLPVIGSETRTPMQAFYFTTTFNEAQCNQAPDNLLIQGPQQIKIDLDVNQANIQIGSTVILSMVDSDTMQLVVLDGQAHVDDLIVPAGFKSFVSLRLPDEAEADQISLVDARIRDGEWTECQPIPAEELAAYQSLENIPPELLNYPITIPDQAEGDCIKVGNVSTAGACGTSFPGPAANRANCCGFMPISPSGIVAYGDVPFTWNPAGRATSYQVNIFTAEGNRYVTSTATSGAETQLNISTPALTDGSEFTWEVSALVDGVVACTTPRVRITRTPGGGSSSGGGSAFTPNVCGNGVCESGNGEDSATCSADC